MAIVRRHVKDPKDAKELISWLEKNFQIERRPDTKLIYVRFRDGKPEEQAAIINIVVDDFLKNHVDNRRDSLTRLMNMDRAALDARRRNGKVTAEQAAKVRESFKKREEYIKTLPALVEHAKAP